MTVAGSVDPAVTVRGTKATGDRRVVPGLISGASLGQIVASGDQNVQNVARKLVTGRLGVGWEERRRPLEFGRAVRGPSD
jgi:hypothetical protein